MKNDIAQICYRGVKEALTQARQRHLKYTEEEHNQIFIDSAKQDIEDYTKALEYLDKYIVGFDKIVKDMLPGKGCL